MYDIILFYKLFINSTVIRQQKSKTKISYIKNEKLIEIGILCLIKNILRKSKPGIRNQLYMRTSQ